MPRARRSLQDSPGSLWRSCDYAVFWSGKVLRQEWPISVADCPPAFSRCRFIMLGVQEGREGKGRGGKR